MKQLMKIYLSSIYDNRGRIFLQTFYKMLLRIPGEKVLLHATISKKNILLYFFLFFKMSTDASESESELEKRRKKDKLKEIEGFKLDFKLKYERK